MFQVFNCRLLLARSSFALDFAFLPCSHTLEAWWHSLCPSSGSLTVSLTLLRRDGAFMQSISDQAGVMQLGYFVSARYCKAAVLAYERVCNLWQILGKQIHGFLVHSAVVTKNEWNHPIIAIRASVFENLALKRDAYICFNSECYVKNIGSRYHHLKFSLKEFQFSNKDSLRRKVKNIIGLNNTCYQHMLLNYNTMVNKCKQYTPIICLIICQSLEPKKRLIMYYFSFISFRFSIYQIISQD
ncbi:Hypothetical_protein [Hexamita inflata]|uniref:Hypothetical_protein n=1 Tax=Hexamita inflata TaxID=28002 RepID=A0AA86Q9L1_9EUKA|nr:Hypothetical protein HINF_LOCUS36397 [Hexamita inflata]